MITKIKEIYAATLDESIKTLNSHLNTNNIPFIIKTLPHHEGKGLNTTYNPKTIWQTNIPNKNPETIAKYQDYQLTVYSPYKLPKNLINNP